MAFESLSNRLTASFKHIVGKDRLSDKNMDQMLKEIRQALLEADVNYSVVKSFINGTKFQYDTKYQEKVLKKKSRKSEVL